MVKRDNIPIPTSIAIAKDCGILGNDVNLKNLSPSYIEDEP